MRVHLFIPCFIDACYPDAGMAVVDVLERLGHEVVGAENVPACCGQPSFNSGYWEEAKPVARRVIETLADAEAIVIPSGSCGAMLKNFYPTLLAGTADETHARQLSAKTFEFSDFLVNQLGVTDVGATFNARVTFHDGCHGLRELGCKQEPRKLLGAVRGLELVEMTEAETCCGFGGTFGVKFPMISTAMGDTKCASALETKADYIVSNDSSCLMQLDGLIQRQRQPIKTIHLAQILASRA